MSLPVINIPVNYETEKGPLTAYPHFFPLICPSRQDQRPSIALCGPRQQRCDRWYSRHGHRGPRRQSGDPEEERSEVHVPAGTCQLCALLFGLF